MARQGLHQMACRKISSVGKAPGPSGRQGPLFFSATPLQPRGSNRARPSRSCSIRVKVAVTPRTSDGRKLARGKRLINVDRAASGTILAENEGPGNHRQRLGSSPATKERAATGWCAALGQSRGYHRRSDFHGQQTPGSAPKGLLLAHAFSKGWYVAPLVGGATPNRRPRSGPPRTSGPGISPCGLKL